MPPMKHHFDNIKETFPDFERRSPDNISNTIADNFEYVRV